MKQLFSVFFFLVFSFSAYAQCLLSDFGPANVSGKSIIEAPMAPVTFIDQQPDGVNGLFSDPNCGLCGTGQQSVADNFTVTVSNSTTGITQIVIWGGYYPEDIPNTTDNFTFILHSDAAGAPGTVIESRTGIQATSRTQTGVILFGTHEYIFTFDFSASPIMLPPGTATYWIEIFNPSVESGNFYWETGTLDPTHGISGSNFATECPGVTWLGSTGYEQSMVITGDDNISGGGFAVPEVLYYLFDETGGTTTQNYAVPGRGAAVANVNGGLTMGPTGQFGSALIGSGGSSSTDYVSNGWIPDLGTSDWTISLYLNNLPAGTALNYLFGGTVAVGWRCFYSGAAGEYGVLMRLTGVGGSDITVPGVGPGPSVLTFVYDSSGPTVYGYINGVLVVTMPQAGMLNVTGTDEFKVGGYGTSAGMPAGSFMDEFRFYDRALSAAEVAATWGISIVPVELTSFTASATGNDVKLLWQTATELNNSGFSVERKSAGSDYMEVGFVPGFGTTSEPKSYVFNDQNLRSGVYTYRLKQVDFDGTFTYSNEVEVEVIAPAEFSLDQNYPNPFNPSTKITFSLATDSRVSLKVFDVIGQEVASLINQDLTAGVHNIDFNAAGINSGVYFYRIEASGVNGAKFVDVKKMILVK
jgi:hypothetical protein